MTKFISRFAKNESGATAIEYGLIAALIAVALITVLGLMSTQLKATFQKVTDTLETENAASSRQQAVRKNTKSGPELKSSGPFFLATQT